MGICRAIVYCFFACAVLLADHCGSFALCLANTLDSMSCCLVMSVGLAKLLGLEPCCNVFSHVPYRD